MASTGMRLRKRMAQSYNDEDNGDDPSPSGSDGLVAIDEQWEEFPKEKMSGGPKRKKKAGKKKNSKGQDNKNQVVLEQSDEDAALVQAAIGE